MASFRPSVYREQFKIALISLNQNHKLTTWSITTLNQQHLFLTLSPFASCPRDKRDATWTIHTVGMQGLVSLSLTTSLIHSSLKCLLHSLKTLLSTYICKTAFAECFQSGLRDFLFHSKALLNSIELYIDMPTRALPHGLILCPAGESEGAYFFAFIKLAPILSAFTRLKFHCT